MTTTFFRFKKLVKRLIKRSVPELLFTYILYFYRFFFSTIPNILHKQRVEKKFRERQVITIHNSSIKIVVDPINGGTDAELFLHQERDVDVINIMKSQLKEGDTFLDIGANIGYETLWGSYLVGITGHVFAFEPLPHLVKQIQESISLNAFSNITTIQKAAGSSAGTAKIYIHKEDAGLTSLTNTENADSILTIDIVAVDEELEKIHSLEILKLDVEGYEFEALQGAEKTISMYKPVIIFEFSPHLYEMNYQGKSKDILLFLHNHGYSIYPIENLSKNIPLSDFENLIENILTDETIPNFVAKQ